MQIVRKKVYFNIENVLETTLETTLETWKAIPNYEDYEASDTGEVRKASTKAILSKSLRSGYFAVSLKVNNKSKIFSVHRLIAMTFHENLENKPTVDHIDRNKLNNHKDNLRWVDYKEQRINRTNEKLGKVLRGERFKYFNNTEIGDI